MANRLDTELLITAGVNGLNHVDNLINTISQAGGNTDQLREAAEQLRNEWDNLSADEQAERLRNLGNAANQGADDVGLLEQQTEDTTSAFDRMKAGVMALAAALGLAFIIGKIKSFFTDAIEGAAEFEQQLATVQAVSGATAEQMARIKTASEELGKSTRYNATEAAEGFEILARAGLNTEQALQTIPSVLALAQGNSLELAEAAGYVTNAVQGMGLEFSDAGRVTDVMAKAAASANTDVAGMGAALSYAAPSAAALGLSLEDTAAYIGKFADAGIDASRAGTSFNGMLSQFSNSTSAFRRELANIGITTGDFNEAIAQLAASGDKGQVAINALGMEAGPALKALLAQGIPALDELKAKLYAAGGTAQEQADVMNNTWQGALSGLGSSWQYLKDTLGESFLAPMTQSFKDLGDMIVGLVDSGKISKLGNSLATVFSESVKAVMDFVARLDFGAMVDKLSNAFDTLRGIGVAINGAFEALSFTFNAIKAGLYAIGGVLAGVIELWATMAQGIVDVGRAMGDALGIPTKALDGLSNGLQGARDAAAGFRSHAADQISQASDSMGNSFRSIAGTAEDTAIDASNALGMIPEEYAKSIENIKAKVAENFNDILKAAEETATDAATYAAQVQAETIKMMEGFDQPEQFAALINSIVDAGNEAVVGAELLQKMGTAAAQGSTEAQAAAEKATSAISTLGDESSRQAAATADAINNAFEALNIDVAQSLTGVNSKTQQTFDLIATGAKSVGESSYGAAEKAKLLASLFAEGMNVAKTAEEFKVLNDMVSAHGLTSVVTAEQKKILKVGMEGGTEAVKAAADAEAKQTAELEKNAEAAAKNAEKSREAANAKDKQAEAATAAAEAEAQVAAKTEQVMGAGWQAAQRHNEQIKERIAKMAELGETEDGTRLIQEKFNQQMAGSYSTWTSMIDRANVLSGAIFDQEKKFTDARDAAIAMTTSLGGAEVTSNDLSRAQGVLNKATTTTIDGIVRMDSQTLSGLQNALDSARRRMQGLADDARDTADQLEATLAKLKGDDDKARDIEQAGKLKDLQEKLNEARSRGNREEIAQLERALALQKQINTEEDKKARAEKNGTTYTPSQSSSSSSSSRDSSSSTQSDTPKSAKTEYNRYGVPVSVERNISGALSANDVANAFESRINQAEKRGAERLAQQLMDEAKRRAW